MAGYLYILSNQAYPSLLKIGQTSESPEKRIRQLSSTGVPFPFLLEACFRVHDPKMVEASTHTALETYRSAQNREFFEVDLQSALQSILPIVTACYESPKPLCSTDRTEPPIPSDELEILQKIVSGGTAYGIAQWRLTESINAKSLEAELVLARLERKKFIKCDRRISSSGPVWLPTTKGINFLHDHNLVEDWMHRGWY